MTKHQVDEAREILAADNHDRRYVPADIRALLQQIIKDADDPARLVERGREVDRAVRDRLFSGVFGLRP